LLGVKTVKVYKETIDCTAGQTTDETMPPRILIFGTGSIGAVYAYILSKAVKASNIFTVCRSNYAAASQNGFTINSNLFGNNLNVRPQVVSSVAEAVKQNGNPFDYILICSKSIKTTPSAAELVAPAVGPHTTIALIQNGIGIEAEYSTLFPENPLLSCVVYLPATQTSPAVISHKEVERLHLGTFPADASSQHKAAAESFVSLLHTANANFKTHDDVQFERWSKLLVNASWNPICALSRSRDAEFLAASPQSLEYVRGVMLEIAAIAQAMGYATIDAKLVDLQIDRARVRALPGVEPSMLADAKAERNMEVDAIVGNALAMAKDKGIQTPLLTSLYVLLRSLDDSFTKKRQEL